MGRFSVFRSDHFPFCEIDPDMLRQNRKGVQRIECDMDDASEIFMPAEQIRPVFLSCLHLVMERDSLKALETFSYQSPGYRCSVDAKTIRQVSLGCTDLLDVVDQSFYPDFCAQFFPDRTGWFKRQKTAIISLDASQGQKFEK